MSARADLLALAGAVAACGSQQESPAPSKSETAAPAADPWASQPRGGADERVPAYTVKVVARGGMVKIRDPAMPEVVGYSALSCVVRVDFFSLPGSNKLDLESDAVRSVLKKSASALADCYDSSRRDGASKSVEVALAVASSGQITNANATGADSKLAACVADAAKRKPFPQQAADVTTIAYEVRFTSPGPKDCPD